MENSLNKKQKIDPAIASSALFFYFKRRCFCLMCVCARSCVCVYVFVCVSGGGGGGGVFFFFQKKRNNILATPTPQWLIFANTLLLLHKWQRRRTKHYNCGLIV